MASLSHRAHRRDVELEIHPAITPSRSRTKNPIENISARIQTVPDLIQLATILSSIASTLATILNSIASTLATRLSSRQTIQLAPACNDLSIQHVRDPIADRYRSMISSSSRRSASNPFAALLY
ncbi:hypothetical protein F2Q69_00019236 [Brassica cretica]|uniref:Uncharacterized protein n=1 Tax=Brassica cretica TaxID=69181 RepID=A0A8S9Q7A7_BRACR|nr:hypothetical protein F2Q69_00019236 [Brassica cretica]